MSVVRVRDSIALIRLMKAQPQADTVAWLDISVRIRILAYGTLLHTPDFTNGATNVLVGTTAVAVFYV